MTNLRRKLTARYLTALRTHLATGDAMNGDRAQSLGRAAVADRLAGIDLTILHERAVA
jgi:hypothetical protein